MSIPPSAEYYNLGSYRRSISGNEAANVWFNRGLVWCYAFNHAEAWRCFEQAVLHDETCPMAHWGLAYAAGPNYNKPWRLFDAADLRHTMSTCHAAARQAHDLLLLLPSTSVTPVERALILAMQKRFPPARAGAGKAVEEEVDYPAIDAAYADAMQAVYEEFGAQDLDVVALYADARMFTHQRKMFDLKTGRPIESSPVYEVQELFNEALAREGGLEHPGLIHLSIHFWEMSATPAVALTAADRLRNLVPDAGHLHHMPTHLDILIGDYRRSVDSNLAATIADDKYLAHRGAKNMYSFYRMHDYHSLIYAAMLSGRYAVAVSAVDRMEVSLTDDVLRVTSPPLADWLEFFKSVRVHVYIRFGRWEEIKALPLPEDQELYCVTTAVTHYGKGIAYAATGDLVHADEERVKYHAAVQRVPASRMDYPNKMLDIFKVATAMLDGEIEYRRGEDYTAAFAHLRTAIEHDDALLYTEPWGWMVPTRHAYAALSLEQGLVEQAAAAYAADLGLDPTISRAHQHPNNVWALHGYYECLTKLGRHAEAQIIKPQLDVALRVADVEITSSCFCRLSCGAKLCK
ncbi:hypothetical protein ASPZODRAFT_157068 [Penicilliopsis zonata CBS 506.65]|uniref:TPR domain protein n=1 Tax=Penicilliopsis zonata CBS 506.65 TaxID=1073090 RepID=A0A1L9SSA8_9EURO|nr:hypothetical protein ASPZODRAFT_157068 [Penicilliopsis zonata CBS 506.65]OJJ50090.1 hypothetical protein ASPZODRAFT_157068 [Penicilliopsis zonata CBS 506.65]